MEDPDSRSYQLRQRLNAWAPVSVLFLLVMAVDGQLFASVSNFLIGFFGAASVMVFVFIPKEMFAEYGKPDEEPDRFKVRGSQYAVVFFGYVCTFISGVVLIYRLIP